MANGQKGARPQPVVAKGLTEAVLFVSRASIRPLLRQELKNAGIVTLHNVDSDEACSAALARFPEALFILDWEQGPGVVNAALRHAKGAYGIDTRPIFMIAMDMSEQLVATAAEYYVSRIHAGEISRGGVQEHLDFLVDQESAELGLRVQLMRVADARYRDDWVGASQLLTELHRRFPDDRRVTCELAENFIHEGRWGEAAAIVDLLTVTSHHNLRVQHLKARCLMKKGAFEEAATLLQETRLINPFNVDRLVDLGRAYMQVDRVRDALSVFNEALTLDPGSKDAALGEMQCKLMSGEVNEALELMRQMTTPRELAALFNNAAVLSIRHSRFDQGLTLYHTAIGAIGTKDTLVSRLFYNLGLAHYKHGKIAEALDSFEQAVKIDPTFDKAKHNFQVVTGRLAKEAGASPTGESPRLDDNFADVNDEENLTTAEVRGKPAGAA